MEGKRRQEKKILQSEIRDRKLLEDVEKAKLRLQQMHPPGRDPQNVKRTESLLQMKSVQEEAVRQGKMRHPVYQEDEISALFKKQKEKAEAEKLKAIKNKESCSSTGPWQSLPFLGPLVSTTEVKEAVGQGEMRRPVYEEDELSSQFEKEKSEKEKAEKEKYKESGSSMGSSLSLPVRATGKDLIKDDKIVYDPTNETLQNFMQSYEDDEGTRSLGINAGSGLVGLWVGFSETCDDLLLSVTPGDRRLLGISYSANQLLKNLGGIPLFEILEVKDNHGLYNQVVFLGRTSTKKPSNVEIENSALVDTKARTVSDDFTEDYLQCILGFLKDRITVTEPFYVDSSNKEDEDPDKDFKCVSAELLDVSVDSFILQTRWNSWNSSRISESPTKVSSKASSDALEMCQYMKFTRITTLLDELDPFNGLYLATFPHYGTLIVQLIRKYGIWRAKANESLEIVEYVEALRLTGDPDLAAGKAIFRAKLVNESCLSNGVQIYEAEGEILRIGLQKCLLLLNLKVGSEMAFLYHLHDQSFLVFFHRFKLPV